MSNTPYFKIYTEVDGKEVLVNPITEHTPYLSSSMSRSAKRKLIRKFKKAASKRKK